MADFDLNKVKGNDRFIAGGAVLLIVLSFFSWYTVNAPRIAGFGGTTASGNLWDVYGILKLALLLAVAAGALVIARLTGALDSTKLPAGVNLITLALSGLATLIFVLRLAGSYHSQSFAGYKVTEHPGIGWYLAILVSGAMTYFAFLNFRASGETMPSMPQSSPPPTEPAPPAPDHPPT